MIVAAAPKVTAHHRIEKSELAIGVGGTRLDRKEKRCSPARRKRSGIRKTNSKRKSRVRQGEVYGDYHRHAAAAYECVAHRHPKHVCVGDCTGHHLKSVKSGGKDFGNVVTVCAQLHAELHTRGRSWVEQRYNLNLKWEAEQVAIDWQKRTKGVGPFAERDS